MRLRLAVILLGKAVGSSQGSIQPHVYRPDRELSAEDCTIFTDGAASIMTQTSVLRMVIVNDLYYVQFTTDPNSLALLDTGSDNLLLSDAKNTLSCLHSRCSDCEIVPSSEQRADVVLGMSLQSAGGLFHNFAKDSFSIFFPRGSKQGKLLLNSTIDPVQHCHQSQQELTTVRVKEGANLWSADLTTFVLKIGKGETAQIFSAEKGQSLSVVFDTGSRYLLLPESLFRSTRRALTLLDVQSLRISSSNGIKVMNLGSTKPPLTFAFTLSQGITIEVTPYTDNGESLIGFTSGNKIILGMPFFKDKAITFNPAEYEIQFCPSKHKMITMSVIHEEPGDNLTCVLSYGSNEAMFNISLGDGEVSIPPSTPGSTISGSLCHGNYCWEQPAKLDQPSAGISIGKSVIDRIASKFDLNKTFSLSLPTEEMYFGYSPNSKTHSFNGLEHIQSQWSVLNPETSERLVITLDPGFVAKIPSSMSSPGCILTIGSLIFNGKVNGECGIEAVDDSSDITLGLEAFTDKVLTMDFENNMVYIEPLSC